MQLKSNPGRLLKNPIRGPDGVTQPGRRTRAISQNAATAEHLKEP